MHERQVLLHEREVELNETEVELNEQSKRLEDRTLLLEKNEKLIKTAKSEVSEAKIEVEHEREEIQKKKAKWGARSNEIELFKQRIRVLEDEAIQAQEELEYIRDDCNRIVERITGEKKLLTVKIEECEHDLASL